MKRAVVVGAGLAGLRAGWELARAGCEVVVLERRSTPGGRAGSLRDAESGETIDTGQHAFMGCYRAMKSWCKDLGTLPSLKFQKRLRVPYALAEGKHREFRAMRLPAPLHLVVGAMAMRGLTAGEQLGLLRLARDILLPPRRKQDGFTVAGWEHVRRLPPAVRRFLIDPLAVAALNEVPAVASAYPFLTVLHTLARSGNAGSAVGFASTGLADLYVPPAVRAIEETGGSVRTGAWAVKLLVREDRAAGVELADGETVEGDAVVAAIPPWDLPPILGDHAPLAGLAKAAAEFTPSPIVTVHLWWDRSVHRAPFSGLPDGPFHWVFNRTVIVGPGKAGHEHLCLVKSGARDLLGRKPDDLAALAAEDLRLRLPAARAARVVRSRTIWETKATVSLGPGTDARRPGAVTPLAGFVLAGDWTRTGLPATIEGAVISGRNAAEAVLASLQ